MHARESSFVVRRPASERMLAVFGGMYLTTTDSEMKRSEIELSGRNALKRYQLPAGEGTPEIMYDIAMRFAKEAFAGEYEAVVAVHTDREHLHAHIIINSVNMVTGYKFQCRRIHIGCRRLWK